MHTCWRDSLLEMELLPPHVVKIVIDALIAEKSLFRHYIALNRDAFYKASEVGDPEDIAVHLALERFLIFCYYTGLYKNFSIKNYCLLRDACASSPEMLEMHGGYIQCDEDIELAIRQAVTDREPILVFFLSSIAVLIADVVMDNSPEFIYSEDFYFRCLLNDGSKSITS